MSETITDGTITAPAGASPPPAVEHPLLGRFVALLTPLFAAAAGWVAGVVAQLVPGVQLDTAQITAFMIAAAGAAGSSAWKWLSGWQQHERTAAACTCPAGPR